MISTSAQEPSFPDTKAKAYYDSINLKIANLEQEEKIKIERIKAKKYPAETEKNEIIKLKAKIKYAIGRYRDKGNLYFRERNLPEPWLEKPANEVSGKTAPANNIEAEKAVSSVKIPPDKTSLGSKDSARPPAKSEMNSRDIPTIKAGKEVPVEKAAPSAIQPAQNSVSNAAADKKPEVAKAKDNSAKTSWNWPAVITVICAIFCIFVSCVSIIISFLRWQKSGPFAKFALGCFAVFNIFLSLVFSVSFVILLFAGSGQDITSNPDQVMAEFMQKNAAEWHDLGANIFAEAVVEKNQEKLFSAIGYLEKACAGDPDNKAITVDLADAYMEVNSPSLTAIAIEFYESVFDSFSDDPLLARIIAGYQQLGNYDAAFALSQKRLENCPATMRRAAAIQMSFIAMSAGKSNEAEVAITTDINKRGDDPLLRLVMSTLKQAKGDQAGALAAVDGVLADKGIDVSTREYALKLKEDIAHE